MNDRPSFAKNKVGLYNTGTTGITGTTESSIKPKDDSVDLIDGKYNSSNLLFKNIDGLANTLFNNQLEELEEQSVQELEKYIEEENDNFQFSTEEEIAQNIDYYLNLNKSNKSTMVKNNISVDNFCRGCGQQYQINDKFCGNCGIQRNKAN